MSEIEQPGHGEATGLNGYADYIFFQYLATTYGNEIIKSIFDASIGKGSVEAVEAALGARGGFKQVWPKFAGTLWNDTTGKLLDEWSIWDKYDYGMSAIFSPSSHLAQKDLQTLEIDQKGAPRAKFSLLKGALKNSFSGNYEIPQRSFFYEHLKFTDSTVHAVLFFNPIAPLPADMREFIRVQAWKKIGGVWKGPEDWTGEPFKQFCLDKSDERLEELLIIVSNSDSNREKGLPFEIDKRLPMQISTSSVGCWQWEGTGSTKFTGVDGTVSDVSAEAGFEAAAIQFGRITFETTSGKARGSQVTPLGDCRITLTGAEKTITLKAPGFPPDGTIDINLDLDLGFGGIGGEPPNRELVDLDGSSRLHTTSSFICPTFNQTTTGEQSWEWIKAERPSDFTVSADGRTIEGSATSTLAGVGTSTTGFKFTAKRE